MKITVNEKNLKESENNEYNVYVGHYELIITDKVLGEPYGFIDTTKLYDNLEDDLLADYPSATIVYDQDIKDEVIANVYPWLEGDENTGSVQFADFSNDVVESKNESEKPLADIYGDGDIITHESSADGFYVDDHDPMGWAILNNDVDTMKELFAGTAPTPGNPWQYAGWDEYTDAPADKDGIYPYRYSWDSERDLNFVENWKRVVGKTNNEEALNLLLEHDPDFIPTAIDFYNAFLAGYDKKLLRKLLDNIRAVWDKDDINDNYLNYDDFGETPYENLIEFLGE